MRDIFLLVEVSDSTVSYDRRLKIPMYAREAIREVWLVDLVTRVVEQNLGPSAGGYRERRVMPAGDSIAPVAFPELIIPVADILG